MNLGYANPCKINVEVRADHLFGGKVLPRMFHANVGPNIVVKVTNQVEAPALKAGGQGTRYTCDVFGKSIYLFHDCDDWFVESGGGPIWFVNDNGDEFYIGNEEV